jgi:hypothetical protein
MTDLPLVPRVDWHYDSTRDTNDGKAWVEMDVEDLRASLKAGKSIEEAASVLCRAGTVDDVRRKAEELDLL